MIIITVSHQGDYMRGSISYRVNRYQQRQLWSELRRAGFQFSKVKYAFWRATDTEHSLTFYRSGKLLIQGRDPERVARQLQSKGFQLLCAYPIAPERAHVSKWIGTDESGKGAYFGPLVIAGVLVTPETRKELMTIGVRDSKLLSDIRIKELTSVIKDLTPHSIVVIPASRYNNAYDTLRDHGKFFRILAWGHARAIEKILEKEDCQYAVSDQFGNEKYIKNALANKGIDITLEQRYHAEDDMAVAAASILARNEYMENLEILSTEYLITLTPGTSDKVIETGKEFVSKHGADKLREVAKYHFATTARILK